MAVFEEVKARNLQMMEQMPREKINITLPDGKVIEGTSFETTPLMVAKELSNSLANKVLAAKIKYTKRVASLDEGLVVTEEEEGHGPVEEGWKVMDAFRPLEGDCHIQLLTFADEEGQVVFRHSGAHVLGTALEVGFGVHLCYGPPTTDGFYYDSHIGEEKFTESHYKDIEKEAAAAVKAKHSFERVIMTKEEALRMFAYNPFKVQLIQNKIPDGGKATAYRSGPLIDLCTGPHVPNTGLIKAFKVMKNSSSYWLGKAENDSLQRVYGTAFPDKKQLDEYIHFLKEAELRDHRNIGKQQNLFYHHMYSPGSWFFTKEGTHIYNRLIEFMRRQYLCRGF